MTVTDRTAASEQEFRARIAAFDAAPTPPEITEAVWVAALANVTHSAACHCTVCRLRYPFDEPDQ